MYKISAAIAFIITVFVIMGGAREEKGVGGSAFHKNDITRVFHPFGAIRPGHG